jgi:glycosyltransferase involved in cell wall biosynthesis
MTDQKSLRIGVDMRALLTGGISGIEQYTISVLSELLKSDHDNTYVLFYVSYKDIDELMVKLLEQYPILKSPNVEIRKLKWVNFPLLLHAFFKPLDWPKADIVCGGLDAMWMPAPRLLPLSNKCAKVTTFHDLIFLLFPQFFTLSSRIWQWQMNFGYEARTSDAVIAVSKNTKRDIIKLLHTDPGKIKVIYEGVAPEFFEPISDSVWREVKAKWQLPEHYTYYVGSVEPRKNLLTVVRALHQLKQEMGDTIKLVVSGGKSWLTSELYQQISELGLTDQVIFTGRVTETEKIALLQHAEVFVFPSFYEGFGLMVLEAFASGCPVITSNNSALPEVVGDAGILIDATDAPKLALEIKNIFEHPDLRNDLVHRGREFARKFTWSATASATLDTIRQAVQHHAGN